MISFMMIEFCFFLIGNNFLLFRPVEDVRDREHCDNCDELVAAVEIDRS